MANVSTTFVSLIDMLMVGRLGSLAVASVGLGGQFSWFMMPMMFAISTGTIAIVARHIGMNDPETAGKVTEQSIYLSLIMSIPIVLVGLFLGDDALALMGAEREVIELGYAYIQILFAFYSFQFVGFTVISALRGAGDTKTPMKLTIFTSVSNVVLNYLLIFGMFGFPRLEVRGAALGSGLAIMFTFVIGYLLLTKGNLVLRLHMEWRLDREISQRILRIGIPATIERFIFSFYNFIYISIITRFGTLALAAHQIGLRVESIAYMPAFGFNVATASLVGQYLGADEEENAEKTVHESLKMVSLFMGVMGVILVVFPQYLAMPFLNSADPNYAEIVRLASVYLIVVGVSEIPLGWIFSLTGTLRGAGDTKSPLYVTIVNKTLFRLLPSYLLGFTLGYGVVGVWIAMTIETFTTAAMLYWIVKRGKWKQIEV
jgi:putative MATE family efflux protein